MHSYLKGLCDQTQCFYKFINEVKTCFKILKYKNIKGTQIDFLSESTLAYQNYEIFHTSSLYLVKKSSQNCFLLSKTPAGNSNSELVMESMFLKCIKTLDNTLIWLQVNKTISEDIIWRQ